MTNSAPHSVMDRPDGIRASLTKQSPHPALDKPWRGRGALRCALEQARLMLRPPVQVYAPKPGSLLIERNVPVVVRDGTTLRANVFRPTGAGPFPVIVSTQPYGKDKVPRLRRRGARLSFQFHAMRQTGPLTISTLTSWEAPDPAWWAARGYAVINADLRGSGASDGTGALLSDLEATDVYDVIEWAGTQPWSTGRVGFLGVSYLAISQYKAAALRPPHLVAMCPWEGLTDMYRDLASPGGIAENGFFRVWTTGARHTMRLSTDLAAARKAHPRRDDLWDSLTPDLASIEVPMLVCASFSDNNVHSRGSFRAFEQTGSEHRYAYTHRGGKWTTFYSAAAHEAQCTFLDHYLQPGGLTPADGTASHLDASPATAPPIPAHTAAPLPPVRLEVRADRDTVTAVRQEQEWPLERTAWTPLYLAGDGMLADHSPTQTGQLSFRARRRAAAFSYTFAEDTEITGPMSARLWISVRGASDVDLFLGVEKWQGGKYVGFEGSYGFPRDRVTTGWQKASLRELDTAQSSVGQPVPTLRRAEPLAPGQVVPVDIPLGPSATLFRAGESLRLVIAGRWLWPSNPLTGQFPARFPHGPHSSRTRLTLHFSPDCPAQLLVPVIPPSKP